MIRLDGMLTEGASVISGEQLFLLHDTFGCPPDLVLDILRERGLAPAPDAMEHYETLMDKQRERARGASKFAGTIGLPAELVASLHATEFKGYEKLECDGCRVVALLRDGQPVSALEAGERGIVLLDRTPFYAESGGQVGDAGVLCASTGVRFQVEDTQKLSAIFHGHVGVMDSGRISIGDKLSARVDDGRRQATVINHSATHLLHAALRSVLGEHVSQKGSLVTPERTRFDFSHFQSVTAEQLQRIEDLVNAEIRRNAEAEVHHMGMQEALDFGAMALFGEKYGERVRVLRMGDFSTELCGGTHVHRTGDIGVFKILSEVGVAAGVRRIEATTGANAVAAFKYNESVLQKAAELIGARSHDVVDKLNQLLERQKKLELALEAYKAKAASGQSAELAAQAIEIAGIKLVKLRIESGDPKGLRELVDNLKVQLPDSVIVLAAAQDGKASLVAGVQGRAQTKIKAGDVLAHIAAQIGGKGGGRADFAQGGGEDGPALLKAMAELDEWLAGRLT
jgi:alanyl-tRNA synthetase